MGVQYMLPKNRPQVNVTTQNIKYPDKIVMVISVPIGSNKFYMTNGKDIWVKVGADKRRAKREEIRDYSNLQDTLRMKCQLKTQI